MCRPNDQAPRTTARTTNRSITSTTCDATLQDVSARRRARLAGMRGRVVMCATPGDEARRWSFVAAEPSATLIARGRSLVVLDAAGRPTRRFTGDPLDATEAFLAEHGCHLEPCSAAPEPRVFGYLGYDLARVVERLPGGAALGHDGPDLWLGAYGAVARWSAEGGSIVGADPDACAALAEALAQPADRRCRHRSARSPPRTTTRTTPRASSACATTWRRRRRPGPPGAPAVARIRCPAMHSRSTPRLTEAAPAFYQALLETDGAALVISSPARFLASVDDHEPWDTPGTAAGTGYAVLLRAMFRQTRSPAHPGCARWR